MPSYAEIVERDFSDLTAAADDLESAAGKIAEVGENYAARVGALAGTHAAWQGLSAEAADLRLSTTTAELGAAETEARALVALLRDGVSLLTEARRALLDVVAEAEEAGFAVNGTGAVLDALDRTGIPELEDARAEWQLALNRAVARVGEADENLRLALVEVVDAPAGSVFNGSASSGLDEVLGGRAQELLGRLGEGEELSPAEWQELSWLLDHNADDPEFSRALLDGMGASGLIDLSALLTGQSLGGDLSEAHRARAEQLHGQLAAVLATATDVPTLTPGSAEYAQWSRTEEGRFYTGFMTDLHEAGLTEYTVPGVTNETVRGYQLLVGQLQAAEGTYSERFLHDLTDDLLAAENPATGGDAGIWQTIVADLETGNSALSFDSAWLARDPVDGALGLMGAQPEVAASYLDPQDGNDRLDYLVHERHFGQILVPTGAHTTPVPVHDGFADAVQAAVTGRAASEGLNPGQTHSDANIRIAEHLWNHFAADPDLVTDTRYTYMQPILGDIAAEYVGEVGTASRGIGPDMGEVSFDSAGTGRLLWQIGHNPDAYATVSAANQAEMFLSVNEVIGSRLDDEQNLRDATASVVNRHAFTAGILTDATATAQYDDAMSPTTRDALIDQAKELTTLAMSGLIFGGLKDYPGEAAITSLQQQSITDAAFELFRIDNSIEATQDAQRNYAESRVAFLDTVEAVIDAALAGQQIPEGSLDRRLLEDSVLDGASTTYISGNVLKDNRINPSD
ncbi:DUF6571 family protein [Streptomyces sp. RFCAC02]|uniref:DUF6571 family protein n=1 Tax=Streptomyces sp. RFCAC02 TaxID=2499143 RepID=UPI001020DFA0|nr:DUF6571 family protein [Streptomyces sp. RFCAC02]